MVISAMVGAIPALMAINASILPVPLAARPFAGMLLVQVNVVAGPAGLETGVAGAPSPLQNIWLRIVFTVGVGLTVMVYVKGVPTHPSNVGVMVISATLEVIPALVAMKASISPVPLAASPFAGMLLVQAKVVPAPTGLETRFSGTLMPSHQVWFVMVFTVGKGLTVIVKIKGVPGHPLTVGIMVTFEVTGDVVLLVAVKEGILPVPEAARPIVGSLFVHAKVAPAPDGLVTAVIVVTSS